MLLDEFLEGTEWSKADVAGYLKISRSAVSQWVQVPERYENDLLRVMESGEVYNPNHPKHLPDGELEVIIRGRSKTTDWDICQEHGWRVWEFREAICEWVSRNPYQPNKGEPS